MLLPQLEILFHFWQHALPFWMMAYHLHPEDNVVWCPDPQHLGMLLWIALAGTPPFQESSHAVIDQHGGIKTTSLSSKLRTTWKGHSSFRALQGLVETFIRTAPQPAFSLCALLLPFLLLHSSQFQKHLINLLPANLHLRVYFLQFFCLWYNFKIPCTI